MKYALNLAEDNRILSACIVMTRGNYDGMPIVDTLPDGNIADYIYADGKYVHDPIPQPEPEPTQPTLESRVETLETTTDDIILLMADLIGGE